METNTVAAVKNSLPHLIHQLEAEGTAQSTAMTQQWRP